jgi:hypothetical protein
MVQNVYTFSPYPVPQTYMNILNKLYWHLENDATLPLFFQLFILHKDVLQKKVMQNTMGKPNLTTTPLKN